MFEFETLQQLTDIETIVGLKDSGGDLAYFEQAIKLKEQRPDWSILIGPEAMLPDAMQLGGDGGVAGGANVVPQLFVACYEACVTGDESRITELQRRIVTFQTLYDIGKYASRHIKATKCCLSLLNICDDFMAQPFHSFKSPERARVHETLKQGFPDFLEPACASTSTRSAETKSKP